ncbi:MAG TPA: isoprenylcysteine carboxylmethyltransferase family protein [Vicinamibacterales bacterium]
MIGRAFSIAGGLLFAASIGYFLWFYLFGLERRAPEPALWAPLTYNVALFSIFALHHSVFARTGARAWMARNVSPRLERAIYVWVASVSFLAVCVWWRAAGEPLWHAGGGARIALRVLQGAGIVFTLWAARALDALALAGIRQLDAPLPPSGVESSSASLQAHGPYGIVRHPIYLGWLLIVWAAPTMTPSHLAFAAVSTVYLVIATVYEERTLHETFGPAYADYARKVRRKMVPGVY